MPRWVRGCKPLPTPEDSEVNLLEQSNILESGYFLRSKLSLEMYRKIKTKFSFYAKIYANNQSLRMCHYTPQETLDKLKGAVFDRF